MGFRGQDRTFVDIYHIVLVAAKITNSLFDSVKMPFCPGAISELLRARDNIDTFDVDLTDAVQTITNYIRLGLELSRISELLKVASDKNAKILA